ncbi:MAG: hypothetical protein Terrestrivirus7_49 [Terrestrivirus sp.]|uniref:Uncharacterized protein n=1 Tax=Terrestrivirus sp. TaxID=2487775 RepID=A0A3G4ZNN5_9VIRU|nr:MAG: hypothetical protein Terrestrivirus7_49 [Terrestrivirus sp.]
MLSLKLTTIKNEIGKMNEISGFKKMVNEHGRINKELNDCQEYVNNLIKTMNNNDSDSNDNNNVVDINDEQYAQYIDDLKSVSDIFDQIENVEDQMKLYFDSMNKIKMVTVYLNKRKMDIVTVE